jgi:hypothetical protein
VPPEDLDVYPRYPYRTVGLRSGRTAVEQNTDRTRIISRSSQHQHRTGWMIPTIHFIDRDREPVAQPINQAANALSSVLSGACPWDRKSQPQHAHEDAFVRRQWLDLFDQFLGIGLNQVALFQFIEAV